MSDEEASSESPDEAAAADGGAEPTEGGGVAVAVREEAESPAVATGPPVDPRVEQRKSRFWLPLLIPVGAVAVVALFTLNLSRVFIVASEGDKNLAVLIGIGLTIAILVGATVIAALPEIRTSSLVLGMTGVAVVVLLAGSLVLGASLPEAEEAAGYVEPAGPAINTLEVDALPELRFQSDRFEVPGGINLIKYLDKGGTHTLVFDENAVPGFLLQVPVGKDQAKVDLTPNSEYVIFCTIPGHRAAGMEADLVVGPKGEATEPGTGNPTSTTSPVGTGTTVPSGNPDQDPGAVEHGRIVTTTMIKRVLAVAALAAVVAACGGSGDSEADFKEPTGPAVDTLSIDSGNVFFKPNELDSMPGIVEMKLKNIESGTHDLVIRGIAGFQLEVSGEGSTASSKVELTKKKYEFYCTIPGHEEAGMKGTITVS